MSADRAAMNSAIRGGLTMGGALFAVCGEPGSGMFTTKSVPSGTPVRFSAENEADSPTALLLCNASELEGAPRRRRRRPAGS
jgi:hypothetical protein